MCYFNFFNFLVTVELTYHSTPISSFHKPRMKNEEVQMLPYLSISYKKLSYIQESFLFIITLDVSPIPLLIFLLELLLPPDLLLDHS